MAGLGLMLREGGWGAYLAFFVGIVGFMVGVTALVTVAFSRRAAVWVGVAAIALAMIAPAIGLLGMKSGRHKTEAAVGMIESSSARERILKMGYLEAQNAATIGFGAAIAPLVLGLVAALIGGTGKQRVAAGAVAAAAMVPTAGALIASKQPLPKGAYDFDLLDDAKWNLVRARDLVDTRPEIGCDEYDEALRQLGGDPTPVLPNWRDAATKCAQRIFDDIQAHKSTKWTSKKLEDSPLLVDEKLRLDVKEYTLSHGAGTGSGGFGFGRGHLGKAPLAEVDDTSKPTVDGMLSPLTIQRIVRGKYRAIRACYQAGLTRNPALTGRVTTTFIINADGTVGVVSDAGSDIADSAVAGCVRGVFKTLVFPAPEGGGTVTATYPIMFSSER